MEEKTPYPIGTLLVNYFGCIVMYNSETKNGCFKATVIRRVGNGSPAGSIIDDFVHEYYEPYLEPYTLLTVTTPPTHSNN